MMSRRCEYALRALVDLGLAREEGRDRLAVQEIAARERIPAPFLEQILGDLRRAGILRSRRGPRGGYSLARTPRQVRIGTVVRLLDGPLAPLSCASRTAFAPCSCPDVEHCGVRMIMVDARNAMASSLDRVTLADAVRRTRAACRRDRTAIPFAGKER